MAETRYALISRWCLLRAVCLAVLLSGAMPAFAEERTAVEGTVVDSQEKPVSGAEVALEFPDGTVETRHADPEGRFRFEDVKPGPATLRVTAKGFEVLRQAIAGKDAAATLRLHLRIAPLRTGVTVTDSHPADLRMQVDEIYNRNKSISTLNGLDLVNFNPVANYSALRLLPGVMTAAYGGRDRFSLPTHIRGGHAWGIVETIDDYPAINITPVNAEDGGYTAGFSSVIPSIAVESLSVATGGLGVSYGQASGGVVRNQIRRGSVGNITSSVRLEMLSLGEGIVMGDTGGGFGRVDYYVAGQSSLADYGTAYDTFPRPIEGLRLGSGVAKVGLRVTRSSRWETMYAGGGERHDYFQNATIAGQPARREFHTDKSNHFLATRYDWRRSEDLGFGLGVTQNWFHEDRIEDFAAGVPVGLSRRNRPQRATRAFSTFTGALPLRTPFPIRHREAAISPGTGSGISPPRPSASLSANRRATGAIPLQ
ncbi:MAG TPA: carboxypeptidase regulatory-like domain-containing protein [Bryobacteraceae bacterium]|nr:carboxypeptidase regulatory-like domain-containing protein [Bryobacteraceae bacterium]